MTQQAQMGQKNTGGKGRNVDEDNGADKSEDNEDTSGENDDKSHGESEESIGLVDRSCR